MEPERLEIEDLEDEMDLFSSWILVDDDYSWQENAACKGMGVDVFFLDQGEGHLHAKVKRIRELCASCPVRERCLDWAVTNMIPAGFWGGMAPRERQRIRSGRDA